MSAAERLLGLRPSGLKMCHEALGMCVINAHLLLALLVVIMRLVHNRKCKVCTVSRKVMCKYLPIPDVPVVTYTIQLPLQHACLLQACNPG